MYKLVYTAEARDQILKLDTAALRQIQKALERLAADPSLGKRLYHELSEFFSSRSGDYRVLYKILRQEVTVLVLTVGHRKDIYRKISRQI